MNNLSNSVYNYFLQNFEELPLDKQFHFAVRLHAWNDDKVSKKLLKRLKPTLLPIDVANTLYAIQDDKLIPLLPGNQNLLHIRQAYNERYPLLRSAARVLYWALMLDYAYGTDSRQAIHSVLPHADLQALYNSLLEDRGAVAMLSTHAVNFLYLYTHYFQAETDLDTERFLGIGADNELYDASNPLHRQLRMYLLTHTLIAESLFYTQPLLPNRRATYVQIITQLETLLQEHMHEISLDNKLEFLVCCRLVNYTSYYEAIILQEAESSVSEHGTFLVDKHNLSGAIYTSFEKSEHRNVLYLMATLSKK